MDLFELLKESVPKRDKLKQLIVAHTGLSPPAFVVAVTAGAATVAAITCYFKSTCCAATDCDTEIGSNGMEDSGPTESQTSNCKCKATEEAINTEANREVSILSLDEEVRARELVADIIASDYMQVDADEMATPVETPKEF